MGDIDLRASQSLCGGERAEYSYIPGPSLCLCPLVDVDEVE